MSVKVMAEVWELDLPGEEQQVLLALADHAKDDGTRCFPSVPYTAWKVGKSERSVQYILARLKGKGLIVPVANEQGGFHPTEYTIVTSAGRRKPPLQKGAKSAPVQPTAPEGVQPTAEGVQPTAERGATHCTRTIINRQLESSGETVRRSIRERKFLTNRMLEWFPKTFHVTRDVTKETLNAYEELEAAYSERGRSDFEDKIRECSSVGWAWSTTLTSLRGELLGTTNGPRGPSAPYNKVKEDPHEAIRRWQEGR